MSSRWNRNTYEMPYNRATIESQRDSLISRLMPQLSIGGPSCITLKKTEELLVWNYMVAKRIHLYPSSAGDTFNQILRRCRALNIEPAIAKALGVDYVMRDEIDFSDEDSWRFDIKDPLTGLRLEIKQQVGYDMFHYPKVHMKTLEEATWDRKVDFIIGAHINERPDCYQVFPTIMIYAPAFFVYGQELQTNEDRWSFQNKSNVGLTSFCQENTPYLDFKVKQEKNRKKILGEHYASDSSGT